MIDLLQAIILGIVQGLTEWLPVSSSGHLALLQLAMGLEVPVFFDLVLHIGTLTGVFAIYKKTSFLYCLRYTDFLAFTYLPGIAVVLNPHLTELTSHILA